MTQVTDPAIILLDCCDGGTVLVKRGDQIKRGTRNCAFRSDRQRQRAGIAFRGPQRRDAARSDALPQDLARCVGGFQLQRVPVMMVHSPNV